MGVVAGDGLIQRVVKRLLVDRLRRARLRGKSRPGRAGGVITRAAGVGALGVGGRQLRSRSQPASIGGESNGGISVNVRGRAG